jgi:hypothetical protein
LHGLPPALTSITRVERGFTLSPDTRVTLRLEDFLNAAGTSSFGLPNVHSNVNVTHGPLLRHDSFDQTASGVIHVANIRATRQTCTETPELDLKI